MAFTGLSANSGKHLQLDAGAFVKNWDEATDTWETAKSSGKLIGATAGGGSFAAVPTVRRIEVDGAKSAVKGFEALDEWQVTLTANVKEITADTLKMALATGKSAKQSNGYEKITAAAELSDDCYIDNITWVGRISGSSEPVIIIVKNALCTNGLTLTPTDKSEGVVSLTLTGHSEATDVDEPPFVILYPNVQ